MTMQEFYQAGISRAARTGETLDQIVNGIQPETINDVRALLKMLPTTGVIALPEPARSLAESLKRKFKEAST